MSRSLRAVFAFSFAAALLVPSFAAAAPLVATNLSAQNATGVYGTTATLTATLKNFITQSPISGKTIYFTVSGVPVGSATTNASGVATLNNAAVFGVRVGTHNNYIGAAYLGGSGFIGSIDLANLTITPKPLLVTGITANNKPFDNSTTATLNTGSAALSGVVILDTITLNTGSATGAFSDANPGLGKTVQVSGLSISGARASNYTLTQPTTTADITVSCDTNSSFDSFVPGSVNGQGGWSSTGPFDQAVTTNNRYSTFGCQTLRISNAVTSGSFGDQTFSYSIPNEAGETTAQNGGKSGGIRQTHFEASFDLGVATSSYQPGLSMSVSPDRGDGARMSYLRFEDQADGTHVFFDDYFAGDFRETEIATLNRTAPHNIKFVMDFVDGTANDVVEIYIDGVSKIVGTSWEDYFRVEEGNPTRTVDSLLFRVGGTAVPAHAGKGFFVDNVSITTPEPVAVTENTTTSVITAGSLATDSWFFYNDENETMNSALGAFVAGPATAPAGAGSAQISVSGTQRVNLATYQFANTQLSKIKTFKFSTYNALAGNGAGVGSNRSGYLQFNVSFNGTDTWQKRLVYLPSQNGTVVQDSWQEWDAINNGTALWSWSGYAANGNKWPDNNTSVYRTWNSILTAFPDAEIRATDAFVGVRVGEPYANGYTENIDAFKFGTSTGSTINTTLFDFEPDSVAPSVPTLLTPENHTTLLTNEFDFTWEPSTDDQSGDVSYEFHSSLDSTQSGGVLTNGLWTSNILTTPSIHSSGAPDGTWYWQVRAKDVAGNWSAWSDIWDVTLATHTLPAPTPVSPANNIVTTTAAQQLIDWTDVSNAYTPTTYFYQVSYSPDTNPDGSFVTPLGTVYGPFAVSQIDTPNTPEGTYYWHVYAQDANGNVSPWSITQIIIINNDVPTASFIFPTPGPAATSFQVVFSEPVIQSEAENSANYFLSNWPGAGGSGDLAGDATVVYNTGTNTATVTFTNPGWYISAEQQWGTSGIHNLANTPVTPNPTSAYSTPLVNPEASGTPTTPTPTTSTTQSWTWGAATDPGGSDASGVKTYEYKVIGTTNIDWTDIGNTLGVTTNLGVGTYTLYVRATDNAGNTGAESTGTVTVTAEGVTTHTITVSAGANGTISPTTVAVAEGSEQDRKSVV